MDERDTPYHRRQDMQETLRRERTAREQETGMNDQQGTPTGLSDAQAGEALEALGYPHYRVRSVLVEARQTRSVTLEHHLLVLEAGGFRIETLARPEDAVRLTEENTDPCGHEPEGRETAMAPEPEPEPGLSTEQADLLARLATPPSGPYQPPGEPRYLTEDEARQFIADLGYDWQEAGNAVHGAMAVEGGVYRTLDTHDVAYLTGPGGKHLGYVITAKDAAPAKTVLQIPEPADPEQVYIIPPEQDQAWRDMVALGEEIQGEPQRKAAGEDGLTAVADEQHPDSSWPAGMHEAHCGPKSERDDRCSLGCDCPCHRGEPVPPLASGLTGDEAVAKLVILGYDEEQANRAVADAMTDQMSILPRDHAVWHTVTHPQDRPEGTFAIYTKVPVPGRPGHFQAGPPQIHANTVLTSPGVPETQRLDWAPPDRGQGYYQDGGVPAILGALEVVDAHLDEAGPQWAKDCPEANMARRVGKAQLEAAEAMEELSLLTGENPRKGIHPEARGRMLAELGDTAVAALLGIQSQVKDTGITWTIFLAALAKARGRVPAAGTEAP